MLLTTMHLIKVVKVLWTHEVQPSECTTNYDHCDDAGEALSLLLSTTATKPHDLRSLMASSEC